MIRNIKLPVINHPPVEFKMDLDPANAQDRAVSWYLNHGVFPEPEMIQVMLRALRPGDFAVDCGACTGFFSMLMGALVGPTGKVLAIEPGANNLPKLYANVALNTGNVEVAPVALGAQNGVRDFRLAQNSGFNGFTPSEDFPDAEVVQVTVAPLTALVKQPPRLIKLDIEGAEDEVLAQWMDHDGGYCPYILAEANPHCLERMGSSVAGLRLLTRQHGYETFVILETGQMPVFVPKGVKLLPQRENTNVLFARMESIAELWPELEI